MCKFSDFMLYHGIIQKLNCSTSERRVNHRTCTKDVALSCIWLKHFLKHCVNVFVTLPHLHHSLCPPYRLVCKIQEKNKPKQNLTITLEVHEGEVEGRYSIEGTAQMPGFSFVVRTFMQLSFKMSFVSNSHFLTFLSD